MTEPTDEITLKSPEGEEFEDAAHMYLRAFNVTGRLIAKDLVNFWKSLTEYRIGEYVIAKSTIVVGMGAIFSYQSFAWIGNMAVEPRFQRKGIGTLLLEKLLQISEMKKIHMIALDSSDAGKPLYTTHGFKEECKVLWYEIQGCSSQNFERVHTVQNIPEWCLNLDKKAFGGDRSSLLKLLLAMGGIMVVKDNEGYGIVYKNKVGPVIADNVEAAVAITNYAHTLGARTMDVPLYEVPREFLSQLKGQGVDYATPSTQMVYGDTPQDMKRVFAQVSSALG